ncbi:hypothetical protein N7457_007928 [Penicillium paradoxum]|uniref:uncharacterized protein n=1 Tax=Penicillium paradoxum TaxID=176176 RepID=UPI0025486EB9|nr:uncharacterized protein N7457_007928 [Penicillium paradoxum]KAJ5773032.1 hypothetical protein N7457_007928 [Penicillium paradoxum]
MVFYGQTIDGIPDRGHSLFVTALVMLLIAALFVAIRLATRYYMKKFGWDDFFLVIALVASTMTTVAINLAVVNGYGRHKAEMGENAQLAFKWFFVAQIPYKIALGCTKASILLLYIRIFITKNFQLLAKVCLGVVGAWTVASVLVTAFQCTPVEASWNKTIKDKRCIHKNAWWYSFASISTFTDIVIAILPINPVRQLKLSKRNRIGLYFVFAVGGLYVFTSLDLPLELTKI